MFYVWSSTQVLYCCVWTGLLDAGKGFLSDHFEHIIICMANIYYCCRGYEAYHIWDMVWIPQRHLCIVSFFVVHRYRKLHHSLSHTRSMTPIPHCNHPLARELQKERKMATINLLLAYLLACLVHFHIDRFWHSCLRWSLMRNPFMSIEVGLELQGYYIQGVNHNVGCLKSPAHVYNFVSL